MGCTQSASSAVDKSSPSKPICDDKQLLPPGLDSSLILDSNDYRVVKYIAEGGMVSKKDVSTYAS